MLTCGSQAAVFVNGTWQWFASHQDALRFEAGLLTAKIEQKLTQGESVIITRAMGNALDRVRRTVAKE